MSKKIEKNFHIEPEMAGERLDKRLAVLMPDYSRSVIKHWIDNGMVLVDGKQLKASTKLNGNELISVNAALDSGLDDVGNDIPIDIVFEDEHLMVINKPAGMVVHPGAGNPAGTLLNALLFHRPILHDVPRAGLIHRLDKDTSGLLIVAKSLEAHTRLVKLLEDRDIHRHYLAIAKGQIVAGGTIDLPMGRHPRNRLKMAVTHSGKSAVTHYRVQERFPAHTLLSIQLETGRTHQIRVHMAEQHHAIVGDPLYGGRHQLAKSLPASLREVLQGFTRQALHACQLSFQHPITEQNVSVSADLPEDMQQLLDALRNQNAN